MEIRQYIRNHKLSIIGAILFLEPLWKTLRWLITVLGDLDFVVSRFRDPGWVGDVLEFLLNLPNIITALMLVVGFVLIYWDIKRHRKLQDGQSSVATDIEFIPTNEQGFFHATSTQTDPPAFVGIEGLYVGSMLVGIDKLETDLFVEITVRGFNATGRTLKVANILGNVQFVHVVSSIVEGKGSDFPEQGPLPAPKWITDRGGTEEIKHLSEFQLLLEQRIPRATAIMFAERLQKNESIFLKFDDLDAGLVTDNDRLRLPLWNGVRLIRSEKQVHSSRIISAKMEPMKLKDVWQ